MQLVALLLALACFQFADVLTTAMILQGGGRELMPLAKLIIAQWGVWALFAQKLVALALVAWLLVAGWLYAKHHDQERIMHVGSAPLLAVAAFPFAWNMNELGWSA